MVVIEGDPNTWNALTYGEKNPMNLDYLRNQLATIPQALNDFTNSFYSEARSLFDKYNGSAAQRLIKSVTRSVQSLFGTDTVHSMFELSEIQNANIVMQRWIMANPVVRKLYHDQKCDGYSDTYVDVAPTDIGERHYDYRRVMDGVVVDSDDDWVVKFYPDEMKAGDKELDHVDKMNILSTWEIMEMFIKSGDDPTSPFGSKL
jgi:hypothetical protein